MSIRIQPLVTALSQFSLSALAAIGVTGIVYAGCWWWWWRYSGGGGGGRGREYVRAPLELCCVSVSVVFFCSPVKLLLPSVLNAGAGLLLYQTDTVHVWVYRYINTWSRREGRLISLLQ